MHGYPASAIRFSFEATPVDNRGRYINTPHPHFILKSPTYPLSLWGNMKA